MSEADNLATVKRYLEAIERGLTEEEMAGFFTPDILQEEFPNRLTPNGARRDLSALREAGAKGRKVMSRQRYELLNAVASGDSVAVEVQWTGVLSVAFGTLSVGDEMRARFSVFFDFRDGKIWRQRNYDCFDPW